ncbi:M48 family metallopeptidase [Pigmentiphaga aceris]|uniref:M48 family metallopeptidase n=1 Tax=Pigmentiphaga aceris TaxID=1940612 RepID=A0A5C0AXU6_9BURK|nr:M48 family metallopeptidase [Pigmentiphaga aceris]QEI06985.1 M48 family metallopeptidase [Pigmentiphaga aceris]
MLKHVAVRLTGRRLAAAALFAGVALTGCQTVNTTQSGTVGIDRSQRVFSLVSSEQLDGEAATLYQKTLSDAQTKSALNPSAAETARVRAIAQRLIAQTGTFRQDALAWKWEVNVIGSDEVNAWCMPGGKIAVYTGFMKQVQPTDDELAAVIGHEIAHALREHSRERVSQQMATGFGLNVLNAVTGSQLSTDMASKLADVTFNLPNSRTHETEADRIGVELAARAGFDPRAAVTLWTKMDKIGGSGQPEFLSTHPSAASRIADLQQASARVLPLYKPK